jgi:hypothetical protein
MGFSGGVRDVKCVNEISDQKPCVYKLRILSMTSNSSLHVLYFSAEVSVFIILN